MFRKIKAYISDFLKSDTQKILIIDGARQVGKSYIIREAGTELFENYVEINLLEDSLNNRYFANTKSTSDFYLQLSMIAGDRLKEKENTLIFLDEIQAYPHLLTLLKFLNQDNILFIGIEPELLELIDQDSLGSLDKDLMDFHGELTENVKRSASEIIEIFGELL